MLRIPRKDTEPFIPCFHVVVVVVVVVFIHGNLKQGYFYSDYSTHFYYFFPVSIHLRNDIHCVLQLNVFTYKKLWITNNLIK